MLKLIPQGVVKSTVAVFGFGIGGYNVWRYSVLTRAPHRVVIKEATEITIGEK